MQKFIGLLLATLFLFAGGCAVQPTLSTSSDAERSFDGLYPFEHTVVDRAWARADIDLSGYTKIKLEGAGISFRPAKSAAKSNLAQARANQSNFKIDAKARDRLRRTVSDAFIQELAKLEQFEITEEIGPDVLIIRAGLLDVASKVPADVSARSDIYLTSVGEATLLLEIIDSESGAVLLRAIDRRAAERPGMPFPSNSVSNWVEVKRLAQFWGALLRESLDGMVQSMSLSEDES